MDDLSKDSVLQKTVGGRNCGSLAVLCDDEIRTRKKQEMYVQTKMYNIELAKYMGSTPDAVHWSKYMNLILNVLKLDKKLIATFYEHGVRNEFGLRRLQLQDFQMMRLREESFFWANSPLPILWLVTASCCVID